MRLYAPEARAGKSIQRMRLALKQQTRTVNTGGHTHTHKAGTRANTDTGGAEHTQHARGERGTNKRTSRAGTPTQAHREGEGKLQVGGRKGKGRKRAVRPH